MVKSLRLFLGLWMVLMLSTAGSAQESSPDSTPPGGVLVMRGPGGPGLGGPFLERVELLGFGDHGGKVVTGAPFSAVAVGETKQILADGTTITRKFQSNLFRDTQGRFRKEVTMPAIGPLAASGKKPRSFIVIHDPVAGGGFILDPDEKVAHKIPAKADILAGPNGPGHPAKFEKFAADADGNMKYKRLGPGSDANAKKESLGTQAINGVSAEGTRYTRTIPVGEIGNDKTLTIVREEWYSPDLQIIVQSRHSDPMFGETTYAVTNIQRTAPSNALFAVPSDYTIKEGPRMGRGKHKEFRKGDGPTPPPADGPGLEM